MTTPLSLSTVLTTIAAAIYDLAANPGAVFEISANLKFLARASEMSGDEQQAEFQKVMRAVEVVRKEARTNEKWVKHAYPLQQVTIKLQGTRHSNREKVIEQLETVLARIREGDLAGTSHDDDFGYEFEVQLASPGPSFFDAPAGD